MSLPHPHPHYRHAQAKVLTKFAEYLLKITCTITDSPYDGHQIAVLRVSVITRVDCIREKWGRAFDIQLSPPKNIDLVTHTSADNHGSCCLVLFRITKLLHQPRLASEHFFNTIFTLYYSTKQSLHFSSVQNILHGVSSVSNSWCFVAFTGRLVIAHTRHLQVEVAVTTVIQIAVIATVIQVALTQITTLKINQWNLLCMSLLLLQR